MTACRLGFLVQVRRKGELSPAGRPDFEFSYKYPKELDEPFAVLERLPHNPLLAPPTLRRRK